MSIEIANESGISVDEPTLAELARFVLDEMRIHPLAELSVLLVDAATIADLHQRWLGEAGPTDVLAFPMDELRPPPPGSDRNDRAGAADAGTAPGLLGDVVLCPEVATEQAREAQRPVTEELELLCTHGILHLLGFDHVEPDERATMFGLQDRLLGAWRAERAPGQDAAGPDAGEPAGSAPAAAELGMGERDPGKLGMGGRRAGQPGAGESDAEQPGTGESDAEQPGTGESDAEQLGAAGRKAGQPGAGESAGERDESG